MLSVTWTVIVYFTGRFFWKVLTLPERHSSALPGPEGQRTREQETAEPE